MTREPHFPEFIDSSMLSSHSCPTKFFYQYVMNLAPYDKSVHLHAGGVLAGALQEMRLRFYMDKLPFERAVFCGMRKFIKDWGEYEAPEFGSGKFKDFVNTLAAYLDYCHHYHPATDSIQPFVKVDGTPAVEFTFAIPLPINHPVTGQPILYTGRSDMIGVYNNMKCIVDEKTTYSFSDNWAKQFQMRGQFIGYCWAAQESGMDVNCAVARGIAIQQSQIKHQEVILMYPQWQIERWHLNMLHKVQTLVDIYEEYAQKGWDRHVWPMNYGDACTAYGGCEMFDLCTSEVPENWYETYQDRNWDPLALGA